MSDIIPQEFNLQNVLTHTPGGIYLHIPFCRKACSYCDFHFSTKVSGVEDFVRALLKEIHNRSWEYGSVQTIYFGGGTPSLLSLTQVEQILNALSRFPLELKEVTFEMNPDDADSEYLSGLRSLGINRLSVGFQSLRDHDLAWMGRTHRNSDIISIPEMVAKAGFDNYTVDFIFGMPGMKMSEWIHQLEWAIGQAIPHLSLYALTVEQKTLLHHWIKKGVVSAPVEDQQESEFFAAHDFLTSSGYEHYEVSNYGLPGKTAIHNQSYWSGKPYLGFGPSAHSYSGKTRRWNVANNAMYIKGVNEGAVFFEEEHLSPKDVFNEMVMMGLRTKMGVNLEMMEKRLGRNLVDYLLKAIEKHPRNEVFLVFENRVFLPFDLWFQADGLAADLFFV